MNYPGRIVLYIFAAIFACLSFFMLGWKLFLGVLFFSWGDSIIQYLSKEW